MRAIKATDALRLVINAGLSLPGRFDQQRCKAVAFGRSDGRATRFLPCQLQPALVGVVGLGFAAVCDGVG